MSSQVYKRSSDYLSCDIYIRWCPCESHIPCICTTICTCDIRSHSKSPCFIGETIHSTCSECSILYCTSEGIGTIIESYSSRCYSRVSDSYSSICDSHSLFIERSISTYPKYDIIECSCRICRYDEIS